MQIVKWALTSVPPLAVLGLWRMLPKIDAEFTDHGPWISAYVRVWHRIWTGIEIEWIEVVTPSGLKIDHPAGGRFDRDNPARAVFWRKVPSLAEESHPEIFEFDIKGLNAPPEIISIRTKWVMGDPRIIGWSKRTTRPVRPR